MSPLPFWPRRRRPAAAAVLAALLLPAGGSLLPGAGTPAHGAGLGIDLRAPAQARARARELAQAAFTAHERGDAARALALLDEAEKLYPNQPDAYNLRGAVHLRRGDYARASSAFARAAALDPDLWAARFNLADIPFKQRNFAQARILFDRLVDTTDRYKATTRWELAQYKAGLACLLAGDEAGATKRLSRLMTTGPAPSAASFHAQAALAFAKRDAATGQRLVLAAQAACKPAANALYLPSLAAAGWVTPAAVPVGGPPGTAVAAAGGRAGNSRLIYLPGNLPITEPELPGGAVAGTFTGNPLLGGVVATGRPVPAPTPLVLPVAKPLPEPAPIAVVEETPAPVAAASVPGVTTTLTPTPAVPSVAAEPGPTPVVDLSPAPPAPAVGGESPKS